MSKPIANLKNLREAKFLTQSELSVLAGVAIGVVSNAENGMRVSLSSIKKLAKGLGVKPEKLIVLNEEDKK